MSHTRIAVVGAGVLGAWTAEYLRRAGHQVTLVDASGPAHPKASSGGESRMTRAAYGKDAMSVGSDYATKHGLGWWSWCRRS